MSRAHFLSVAVWDTLLPIPPRKRALDHLRACAESYGEARRKEVSVGTISPQGSLEKLPQTPVSFCHLQGVPSYLLSVPSCG